MWNRRITWQRWEEWNRWCSLLKRPPTPEDVAEHEQQVGFAVADLKANIRHWMYLATREEHAAEDAREQDQDDSTSPTPADAGRSDTTADVTDTDL